MDDDPTLCQGKIYFEGLYLQGNRPGYFPVFVQEDIYNPEEAKKLLEAEFLRYWAKLKSEVENGGHKI